MYPSPTLHVFPGDKLIIHLENGLAGLTIRDYYDPQFASRDEEVPLYPPQLTQAPINLHTHGLRISPKGNSDNVLLHIGAGLSNTYTYDIRKDHPHGVYWYHPHLHALTSPQTYLGLTGLLIVGRADGNIPLVTENHLPIRNLALQYNYVFDRKGGLAQLNNPNWPQYVSTLKKPEGDELAKGTYRPLLSPVNFLDSQKGTQHATVWYAGKLGLYNNRGHFQFIPSNLRSFTADPDSGGGNLPADLSLPDYERDVQFTVNGQFQPVIKSKPGQTEIWVLSNISDMAYMNVQLTETATGNHPKIAILGEDGNPGTAVRYSVQDEGRRLLIPPATRYVIAVTIPEEGDLILEMPSIGEGARAISETGILYTNDGTENPPAVLGSISVLPSATSYNDGFFIFPTQVLAKVIPQGEKGTTVKFAEGQAIDAPNTGFFDASSVTPDFIRKIDVTGGFINNLANPNDPKAFVYAFNGAGFPNAPLIQPRLDSVEEWQFYNYNNDAHPIHVHVNDFQVTRIFDPTIGLVVGPGMWEADTVNLPQPTLLNNPSGDIAVPASLSIRSRFEDYIGTFVMHCHRLNHEDNGLMAVVNIIPAVSTYGVVVPGSAGDATTVNVYDGNGDKLVATVTPFPGYEGVPTVTMGDVDGDGVYDLIVGAGKDYAPEVVVYSGNEVNGKPAFDTELTRFAAFDSDATGGVSVASDDIDGKTSDNIIVGSGPGIDSEVKVFAFTEPGKVPDLYSSFAPYENDKSGVSVASGLVSFMSGRNSIITAPGPGSPAKIRVFDYWLMKPFGLKMSETNLPLQLCSAGSSQPAKIAEITPFGEDYTGGVSLAAGWLYGNLGGAKRIVVSQLAGPGAVKIYSSGSALQGGPALYLSSPVDHASFADFKEEASLMPFPGTNGVRVATTSTTTGADLLVSGVTDKTVKVLKYDFVRPSEKATTVEAKQVSEVYSAAGAAPSVIGGD
jgi:FtsP/CotA-like multicopper oxidase with cupredoxin domain